MLKFISFIFILFFSFKSFTQNPIGKWKVISEINEWQGEKFDSHKALLSQRPCAAKIFYVIHTDGTYRLDDSQSNCEEKYKKIQEKLYSETVWTVTGNVITIGNKKAPSVGQKYTFTLTGNKMVWTGTEGQGTITYQKI
ncbi:MAG: lipocalin family protein [Saprospiraceae bacterium]|nr:lipocalin family protein [Saprospiraceae bacterium]